MVSKVHLQIFVILMCLPFVLSSAAVPTSRSLLSKREESSIQTTLVQGALKSTNGEEMIDTGEEFKVEGRMDLESEDYPGTGANNRHDPKAPGRA